MMAAQKILVFSEEEALLAELLCSIGEKLAPADVELTAFLPGGTPQNTTKFLALADIVYMPDDGENPGLNPEVLVGLLAEAITAARPAVVLIAATRLGLEIAPRLAERLGAAYAAWAVDFHLDRTSQDVTAHCMLYTGLGYVTYRMESAPAILTVAPGGPHIHPLPGRSGRVETIHLIQPAPLLQVVANHAKEVTGPNLEDARIVVDVGQGVRQKEDLQLIADLAQALEGQVGCSRPVSSERDWFPEWLGLSGLKISPQLCLTVGVSGAIQHLIGIRESKVIAAINNDEHAAIFSQADFGVLADLYTFIPVLIERLKARNVHPA
jgi:electron transfer flavoprotein alpha subunit